MPRPGPEKIHIIKTGKEIYCGNVSYDNSMTLAKYLGQKDPAEGTIYCNRCIWRYGILEKKKLTPKKVSKMKGGRVMGKYGK